MKSSTGPRCPKFGDGACWPGWGHTEGRLLTPTLAIPQALDLRLNRRRVNGHPRRDGPSTAECRGVVVDPVEAPEFGYSRPLAFLIALRFRDRPSATVTGYSRCRRPRGSAAAVSESVTRVPLPTVPGPWEDSSPLSMLCLKSMPTMFTMK